MTSHTHDLGAFTALVLVFVLLPELPTVTLLTAITAFGANFIGGLFPDLDQQTSDFWDNFRLGPYVAKLVVPVFGGHRHISHSLVGVFLVGYGAEFLLEFVSRYVLFELQIDIIWNAFMIGVISHLFLDMFTKAGVPLFWPIDWRVGIPPIKALRIVSGEGIEKYLVFPGLLLVNAYLFMTYQGKVLEFLRLYIK
ncbi:MAG: metal-dependent hydrolase [bacterium]|nr:metal-dependent hydrolase [bacterium]